MRLRSAIREAPATYGLAASWVVVYLLMNGWQGGFASEDVSLLGFGAIRTDATHLFGDFTWRDFAHGQPWRAVTATFVHFSLAHLVLNLIGMIQLGRMMEEWYGSRQFLAICLGVGGIGNALGAFLRQGVGLGRTWIQAHGLGRILPSFLADNGPPGMAENIPSAGGSTIILGLIGLGLVVGWRSRTRVGLFLRDQMFGFLAFTAVIGVVGMKVIDNYGHTGGALAGMALGFFHRSLVRSSERGIVGRLALVGSLALMIVSTGGQWLVARQEIGRAHTEVLARERLLQIDAGTLLQEHLAYLAIQFEWVALQRLSQRLQSDRELSCLSIERPLDLSPFYELMRYTKVLPPLPSNPRSQPVATLYKLLTPFYELLRFSQLAPALPTNPYPQSLVTLDKLLSNVSELRTRLDRRVDGPEFDELLRIGDALQMGPVESQDLSVFRLALATLTQRAASFVAELDPNSRLPEERVQLNPGGPVAKTSQFAPQIDRKTSSEKEFQQ